MEKSQRLSQMYEYARTNGMCRNKRSFAELLGIDNGNLSKAFGNDAKYMTDSLLIRVNNALGNVFSFDWLLTGNGEMLNGSNDSTGDSIHHNSGNVATRGAHITTSTDEKDRIIAQLQSQIATLQAQIDAQHEHAELLQSQIATLQAQIAELKADKQNLMQLLTNLTQNK